MTLIISSDINFVTFMMSSDIHFVAFICSVTLFFVTLMMSSDINFVTFMMFSDFCLIDSTVEFVSPGMLQYAVRCRACLFVRICWQIPSSYFSIFRVHIFRC